VKAFASCYLKKINIFAHLSRKEYKNNINKNVKQMQNKGAIRLFAILLALVSLYQLLFTVGTRTMEGKAEDFAKLRAKGNPEVAHLLEASYLDSMKNETALNLLLVKFSYKECKEKEINLGLDLRGGMNLVLEVKVSDILKALSNYNTDPTFQKAIKEAELAERNSSKSFIDLFGDSFTKADPNAKLAAIFSTPDLKEKINLKMSNSEVLKVIEKEAEGAIDNAFNILRNRIDRFGVTQPNIQKLDKTGRVLVELPGVTDPKRVRKLLQGTASLEFWETYDLSEIAQSLGQAEMISRELSSASAKPAAVTATDTTKASAETSNEASELLAKINKGESKIDTAAAANVKSLFSYIIPSQSDGPVVGMVYARDTAKVNVFLNNEQVRNSLPADLRLMWTVKPMELGVNKKTGKEEEAPYQLIAIKVTSHDGRAPLEGDVITRANAEASPKGGFEVSMSMNGEGSRTWARLTRSNIKKSIAIVLDGYVYSFPTVQDEIAGGRSSITGNFTVEEAQDLANILKSGKLPAPARIVEDNVVGPSLGQEAINAGFMSCIVAFLVVLVFMVAYYSRAGWAANVALLSNLFFMFGVLSSFSAVLTLPGLAGIVLTLGMAVDANVLIYERIKEELRAGKGLSLAITDGFKHAFSAILDGNITTLVTGIILFIFGTGPIQGFATTLIIGLCTSLFTAIFITRMVFEWMLKKNINITFSTKLANNALANTNIDFIGVRKVFYGISGAVIFIGLVSSITYGFNYGVDFVGGRSYVIRYDKPVNSAELRNDLLPLFNNEGTEVKTFGSTNQVRVTTKFLIEDENNENADNIITEKLYQASKGMIGSGVTQEQFVSTNIMSSQKVGATISDDIKMKAVWAVFFSLIGIFLYIFLRFKDWRFGLGGVISLLHDTLAVIGIFSIFRNIMPFSLDVDSSFIAALLTVIGYSINDTVVIFDRIREWRTIHTKWTLKELFNGAMNSTLVRTINTSLTVLFVLIVLFIFGGEVIRGFVFAMLIGVIFGVYSTAFNAAAIVYDLLNVKKKDK
jgi:SecD/SecF fusion protein